MEIDKINLLFVRKKGRENFILKNIIILKREGQEIEQFLGFTCFPLSPNQKINPRLPST
jgi:hypothetical protein